MAACSALGVGLVLALATFIGCQGDNNDEVLRVTSIVEEPYLMLRNVSGAKGNALYEGFVVDLLEAVSEYADFEYEIELVPDNHYGRREISGEWNGMVGQVSRGDADLAVAALTITPARRRVVDFAYPFLPVTLTALMRRDVDIESVKELANQTEVGYGTLQEGATQQAFIGAMQPLYRRMWAHMASQQRSPFFRDIAEGLKRVREEDYVMIVERPTGEWMANRPPCDLKVVGRFTTDSLPRSFAFAMSKGDPVLHDINAAMLHLQEDLTVARLYRKWWPDRCTSGAGGATTTVSVFSGTMAVLWAGVLILARGM